MDIMAGRSYRLFNGDCLVGLASLPDCSIDSIVTDPPYGLSFMGKRWDYDVPSTDIWAECLRVLKPGGHLLAFAGTRTQHRMAVRIEDAGFEIRDMIAWVYGSGFPKSLDVSKAIDKMGGVDTSAFKADLRRSVEGSGLSRKYIDAQCGFTMRFDTPYSEDPKGWGVSLPSPEKWVVICQVLGLSPERWTELIERVWRGRAGAEVSGNGSMSGANYERSNKGEACNPLAQQWQGWGTALKPALEPITVARKPLAGTVAANVLAHGAGALNIDGCRAAPTGESRDRIGEASQEQRYTEAGSTNFAAKPGVRGGDPAGRWPANLIHDGSDEVVALFPAETGQSAARFFKSTIPEENVWAENELPHHFASTAVQSSSLQKLADAIAQSDAVTSALPVGTALSVAKAPSTSVTPSESKLIAEAVTQAMPAFVSACLLGLRQDALIPSRNPVRLVARQEQTGTMTITASLSLSAGSVESITFSIMPKNLEAGEKDCEPLSTNRFMYCAKASRKDRGEGNAHPTVKPTDLMAYLCRLVTPPGGVVLDPFMGSGSTGKAAMREGFRFIGCELDADYFNIAKARIKDAHDARTQAK